MPFVDVKVQTPASKALQSVVTMLATSAVVSSATRNLQGISLAKVGGGLRISKGAQDAWSNYGKPFFLMSAPLPLLMVISAVGAAKKA